MQIVLLTKWEGAYGSQFGRRERKGQTHLGEGGEDQEALSWKQLYAERIGQDVWSVSVSDKLRSELPNMASEKVTQTSDKWSQIPYRRRTTKMKKEEEQGMSKVIPLNLEKRKRRANMDKLAEEVLHIILEHDMEQLSDEFFLDHHSIITTFLEESVYKRRVHRKSKNYKPQKLRNIKNKERWALWDVIWRQHKLLEHVMDDAHKFKWHPIYRNRTTESGKKVLDDLIFFIPDYECLMQKLNLTRDQIRYLIENEVRAGHFRKVGHYRHNRTVYAVGYTQTYPKNKKKWEGLGIRRVWFVEE